MSMLPVSDIYGPVLQGEGPYTGWPCWFLRLGFCNLHCTWCDTPYTWDVTRYDIATECPPMTGDEIRERLPSEGMLVLTGGEPVMHRNNDTLRDVLTSWQGMVHVETNGTLLPSDWLTARVDWWTVSPKLAHAGDPHAKRLKPVPLDFFANMARNGAACFKFVISDPSQVEYVANLTRRYHIPENTVYLMPEGVDEATQLAGMKLLEPVCLNNGFNLTSRLHVLLHGNQRGT